MGGSGHIKTGHLKSHLLKSRVRLTTPKVLALRLKSASRDFLSDNDPMSAFGTKRTCELIRRMSVIGGKADVTRTGRYVG